MLNKCILLYFFTFNIKYYIMKKVIRAWKISDLIEIKQVLEYVNESLKKDKNNVYYKR